MLGEGGSSGGRSLLPRWQPPPSDLAGHGGRGQIWQWHAASSPGGSTSRFACVVALIADASTQFMGLATTLNALIQGCGLSVTGMCGCIALRARQ
jgi:hypothetical protein